MESGRKNGSVNLQNVTWHISITEKTKITRIRKVPALRLFFFCQYRLLHLSQSYLQKTSCFACSRSFNFLFKQLEILNDQQETGSDRLDFVCEHDFSDKVKPNNWLDTIQKLKDEFVTDLVIHAFAVHQEVTIVTMQGVRQKCFYPVNSSAS